MKNSNVIPEFEMWKSNPPEAKHMQETNLAVKSPLGGFSQNRTLDVPVSVFPRKTNPTFLQLILECIPIEGPSGIYKCLAELCD
jgi:hypothetical protein